MNTYDQIKEQAEDLIKLSFRMNNPREQGEVRKTAENLLEIAEEIKLEDKAIISAIGEIRKGLEVFQA